jgi:signal transduction protein with GAF and PtsI domain
MASRLIVGLCGASRKEDDMENTKEKYYQLIKDFSKTINSSLNDAEVLQMITRNFVTALDVKACSIYLLSRDLNLLKIRASCGLSDAYLVKGPIHADKSIGDALRGKPVMVYDVTEDSRIQYPEAAKKEGIASILSVPIRVMGKTIGVLRIYTSTRYGFSEDEIELISDLTDLGAVAIDNALYFRSFKSVCTLINKNLDIKEVLDSITRSVARALIVKGCAIYLISKVDNQLKIGSSYGLSEAYLNKGPLDADKALKECLDGRTVCVPDAAKDLRIQFQAEAEREGIASILSVPISVKGKIIGVFRVYTARPHEFTANESEFVSSISEMGGIAIENARMYDRLRLEHEKLIDDAHRWFEFGRPA